MQDYEISLSSDQKILQSWKLAASDEKKYKFSKPDKLSEEYWTQAVKIYSKKHHETAREKELYTISIPKSVTAISDNAFSAFPELENVIINSSKLKISDKAFEGCYKLNSFIIAGPQISSSVLDFLKIHPWIKIFPAENHPTLIKKGPFMIRIVRSSGEKILIKYNMPEYLDFNEYLPGFNEVLEEYEELEAFYDCLNYKESAPENQYYEVRDNSIFYKTGKILFSFPEIEADPKKILKHTNAIKQYYALKRVYSEKKPFIPDCEEVNIPEDVASIRKHAFNGCHNVQSVIIPEGLENISANAFFNCKNLQKVVFKDPNRKLSGKAFSKCELLKK